MNLSVEVWNYYPVTFEEISSAISAFKKEEKKGEPVKVNGQLVTKKRD